MSLFGTFITGTMVGFAIAVLVLSCCEVANKYDTYENGYNNGYMQAMEDFENGKNREPNGGE